MGGTRSEILDALRAVTDPCCRELGISVVDMGVVRSVEVEDGRAQVELILTTGWCPFMNRLVEEVEARVASVPGVTSAEVDLCWEEPWTSDRLSADARRKLRFLPHPAQAGDRDRYVATRKETAHDR